MAITVTNTFATLTNPALSQLDQNFTDITTQAAALASPALTGTPTAPTAAPGTSTTQLATTAFVATSFAPLASPTFTGTVTTPSGTLTSSVATITKPLDISGASAGQIVFPATQNASAGANTLDDYEEGTWTPNDASGAGLSFTITSATYCKIGRSIIGQTLLTYPVTANGSNAVVGGLPFTVANQTAGTIVSQAAQPITTFLTVGTTIQPFAAGSGGVTNANLSNTANRLGFFYQS